MTNEALLQIIENTPMQRRRYCTITGEILPLGEDGLTDPEREQSTKIKAQWGHSNKDKTSI